VHVGNVPSVRRALGILLLRQPRRRQMRLDTHAPGLAVMLVAALGALSGGCYDPKITSGGLTCAPPPAKACPEGFTCSGTVCVTEGTAPATGGSGGGGTGGAGTGGAGGACPNPITPLCSTATVLAAGACDPVCQTGCGCGQRCNLTPSGFSCAASSGSKELGAICQPGSDECALGLVCLAESCGTSLGRCYRYCRDPAPICGGTVCGTPIKLPNGDDSTQKVCNPGDVPCNAFTRTGCPDPALNCYMTGPGRTVCDCSSGKDRALGESCGGYNDCALGLVCLAVGGASMPTCHKVCQTTTDCAGCTNWGSAGYCP
jgi:hypothetical protein